MKKKGLITAIHVLIPAVLAVTAFASSIGPITLTELYDKADLIVMAQVLNVAAKGDQDEVTIKPEVFLKGEGEQAEYTFTLISRGTLEDFDPALSKGDTGVFFLKRKLFLGQVEKAWWGSVAVFVKNNFDPQGKKVGGEADKSLVGWRAYRLKLKQAQNTIDYDSGFRQGFSGPPVMPKGTVDFNLGYSDGQLAREGMVPAW
ncbi:MAG: hypothetical protein AB1724_00715 [Thermodesulfobacteriota bacterium]